MSERRSEVRFNEIELVMLSWDENGTILKQLGNVEDVSLSGMGLVISNALPIGRLVNISYGEASLTGIVRHERRLGEGHFIGIELGPLSRGSTLHFDPEVLVECHSEASVTPIE
jgi:hypothetical protein